MSGTLLGSVSEVIPMPSQFKVEIVPVSEVPPEIPSKESGIEVNGLTAHFVDDGRVSDGRMGVLKQGAVGFEVSGLPRGYKAWITQQDGKCQLTLDVCSAESEWLGEYPSVRDALQALLNKLVETP
jgi:hypothetical protein